jgi:uncharacterized protein with LGFP repeats
VEGYWQKFEYGWVYWSLDTGPHVITNEYIHDKWKEFGLVQGMLGFPIGDEQQTSDQPGRYAHFEGGSIYWNSETCAHEVHGAIRDRWASTGWEEGPLGFPVTDEEYTRNRRDRVTYFQNGHIIWYSQTKATDIHKQPTPKEKWKCNRNRHL